LTPQGDRVLVNVKAVPADVLAQWLTQSRAQAQVLPTEAHLTRVNPSSSNNAASALPAWEGTMVLQLPVGQAKATP
ncbi:MAG: type II secretion system protein M, partial [Betaproteobacteria bacterium]|nr:type II secretion system protein M [Betaproteobacteria bacterium]